MHPTTRKFVAVTESRKRGIWLAAGHVDEGETFEQAAVREAKEEAGIDIELKGILRVEVSPMTPTAMRMRIVYFAVPKHPAAPLKREPDAESENAFWASMEDLERLHAAGQLRGDEPIVFGRYLAAGGIVYPMSAVADEGSDMNADAASQGGFRPWLTSVPDVATAAGAATAAATSAGAALV